MALIPIEERVPPNTEIFDVRGYGGRARQLAYPVNAIVDDIQRAAYDQGFTDPNLFSIFSGYRSDDTQNRLFEQRVAQLMQQDPSLSRPEAERRARKTVAPPGRSSHRSGYAFDVYLGHKQGYRISSSDAPNVAHIESTPAYQFMREIAQGYGLTQLPNEPWHWECDSTCRERYIRSQQSEPAPTTNNNAALIALGVSLGLLTTAIIVKKLRR